MNVPQTRKTLTSFVNQRAKIAGIIANGQGGNYVLPVTSERLAIDRIKRHIDFLSKTSTPLSWAAMVVQMEDSILELLPSECSRFRKQRAEVIAIVNESKLFMKHLKMI
jgi:hypothetical protein